MQLDGQVLLRADLGDLKVRELEWAGENFVVARTSSTQNLGIDYGLEYELSNAIIMDIARGSFRLLLDGSQPRILNATFGMYGLRQQLERCVAFVGTLPLERDAKSRSSWITRFQPQMTRIDLRTGKATRAVMGHGERQRVAAGCSWRHTGKRELRQPQAA